MIPLGKRIMSNPRMRHRRTKARTILGTDGLLTSETRTLVRSTRPILVSKCLPREEYALFEEYYDRTETYIRGMMSTAFIQKVLSTVPSAERGSNTRWWAALNTSIGKPYMSDPLFPSQGTGRDRVWHMMVEPLRATLNSYDERLKILSVITTNNYDENTEYSVIRDAVITKYGLYPTNRAIRNTFDSRNRVTRLNDYYLDFTVVDKNVIRERSSKNGMYKLTMLLDNHEYHWRIPVGCLVTNENATGEYTLPRVTRNKDRELVLTLPYDIETEPVSIRYHDRVIGGVDLGVIKPYVFAFINADGSWSTGHEASRELLRVNRKLELLNTIIKQHTCKMKNREEQVKRRYCRAPVNEYEALRDDMERRNMATHAELGILQVKRARVKRNIAYLYARDIVNTCKRHRVSELHFEEFRSMNRVKGYWDTQRIITQVSTKADTHGITVYTVPIRDTSHTDPFTGKHVDPSSDRLVRLFHGYVLDRDACAALTIAARAPSRRASSIGLQPMVTSARAPLPGHHYRVSTIHEDTILTQNHSRRLKQNRKTCKAYPARYGIMSH